MRGVGESASAADVDGEISYLLSMARRLTRNRHDAHDLVQDAVVRALPVVTSVGRGAHLRAWLVTIVRRIHIDRLRRASREPRTVSIDEVCVEDTGAANDEVERDPVDLDDVHAALTSLPEDFRKVFVLHALEGRPYREIAAALDIPVATVGTRLARARTKLRVLLSDRRTQSTP